MNITDTAPAAEHIDLSVCEREPIHKLGHIQHFGCFIALNVDWIVAFCSANTQDYFKTSPDKIIGTAFKQWLDPQMLHDLRSAYQSAMITSRNERLFSRLLTPTQVTVDISVHFDGTYIIVEFEHIPAGGYSKDSFVRALISQFYRAADTRALLEDMAQQLRFVTGYDRVMIYQFLPDGAGEVVAEAASPELESFSGLRFPASDIPKQARELYVKNLLRVIHDVNSNPIPILPVTHGESATLDLSFSTLRAVSPVHIQYLKNMDVGASLSVSLVIEGKLWGLIACHHQTAKVPSYSMRTDLELFAEVLSLELNARISREREANAQQVRDTHDKIVSTMSRKGNLQDVLAEQLPVFKTLVHCDGIAAVVDGQSQGEGTYLSGQPLLRTLEYLDRQQSSTIVHIDCLATQLPGYDTSYTQIAGLLAIPLSHAPLSYLIFYRKAQPQIVTWAGQPSKLSETTTKEGPPNQANALMPRTSFAAWQQTYHDRAEPWVESDIRSAESLRITLLEVIIYNFQDRDDVQQKASRTHEILISELNHRVRNILSLVSAIIEQTGQQDRTVDEYADVLSKRITALASAHDQLTASRWQEISFRQLLNNEIQAYITKNINLDGPEVMLSPEATTPVVLVLHELLTNAAKYGALSASVEGELSISWQRLANESLYIDWREQIDRELSEPDQNGFGMTLIQRIIPHELSGLVDVKFTSEGLRVRLTIPARYVGMPIQQVENGDLQYEVPLAEQGPLPHSALVIEDNLIIALDTQKKLRAGGIKNVAVVGSLQAAEAYIQKTPPAVIVSDVHLGDVTTFALLERATQAGIPCIIISGYGENLQKTAILKDVPVLTKPVPSKLLLQTLRNYRVAAAAE
ncbi:HWE histidine kinase domain-containing protein [Alteromonas lipotrueiana]|uniref:HWE histidine kinase domain-containing protein n=1 Tax=Alteromonas lipotrueiana TaxID=2803815 RepID=UPI001C4486A1|nr:HWE histidine kinase domain-containing protein [Alteromonas lipotrueiana]